MADQQNPTEPAKKTEAGATTPPQQKSGEVSAGDLLSLWGGGGASSSPPAPATASAFPHKLASTSATVPTPVRPPAPHKESPKTEAAPKVPPKIESPHTPPQSSQKTSEAGAADLLSLWGGASAAPAPKPTHAPAAHMQTSSVPPASSSSSPSQASPGRVSPPHKEPASSVAAFPHQPPVHSAPESTHHQPLHEPTPAAATVKPAPAPPSNVAPPEPTHKKAPEQFNKETWPVEKKPETKTPEAHKSSIHKTEIHKTSEKPHKKSHDVLEGEIVSEKSTKKMPGPPPASQEPTQLNEDEPGFGSQLDEFLSELHLSRRHIFYGFGCLVLGIILVYGAIAGFRYLRSPSSAPKTLTKEQSKSQPQPSTQAKTAPQPQQASRIETGINSSTAAGKIIAINPDFVKKSGIVATISLGTETEGTSDVEQYIMQFRRTQNAYGTNIDELLNQSTDRRSRIESYLALLRKFLDDDSRIGQKIKADLAVIKPAFDEEVKKQQADDANFFEQLTALNAQTAQQLLDDFITSSRRIVALKAHFRALQKIQELYDGALPKLQARIKDIELNKEALIRGIKIYSVQGSDINLILTPQGQTTGGGRSQPQGDLGSFSTPAYPLLPINPAQVTTEHDYITQPGGGFADVKNKSTKK